jgi:site-specific DNA recombinase
LDVLYEEGTLAQKRQIVGSIYPEKLVFDGFQYRTTRLNEAVRLIYTLDKGFSEIKNRKGSKKMHLSGEVAVLEQLSNHFMDDLRRLAAIVA